MLEIGTGSGYQAAVLAAMGVDTFSVEIHPQLCERATWNLRHLGFARAQVRCGDGSRGWPEEAPFDGILVTASGTRIPEALLTQLGQGGRMVIPVGEGVYQDLKVVIRTESGVTERSVLPVSFGELAFDARARCSCSMACHSAVNWFLLPLVHRERPGGGDPLVEQAPAPVAPEAWGTSATCQGAVGSFVRIATWIGSDQTTPVHMPLPPPPWSR